jgi:hypothetical protein
MCRIAIAQVFSVRRMLVHCQRQRYIVSLVIIAATVTFVSCGGRPLNPTESSYRGTWVGSVLDPRGVGTGLMRLTITAGDRFFDTGSWSIAFSGNGYQDRGVVRVDPTQSNSATFGFFLVSDRICQSLAGPFNIELIVSAKLAGDHMVGSFQETACNGPTNVPGSIDLRRQAR